MNWGSCPSMDRVTSVSPESNVRTTPNVTWWMCTPPTWTLRGCHHLVGRPFSTRCRINRTNVRVTKNVRMKATRQHNSGRWPRS